MHYYYFEVKNNVKLIILFTDEKGYDDRSSGSNYYHCFRSR